MTTYRDGIKVSEEGYLTAANLSGYATQLAISSMVTQVQISSMINTTSGLGNWTSSVLTIYEFSTNSFDTVSGADWAAGATATASGGVDVSAPSIAAVVMASGQGVGFGVVVPPNAGTISQRITARHYTSGPTATFTLYQRTIGGTWSGIITGTISGTLLYRNALTSSALTNLPVLAGSYNQFDLGVSCSGNVYLADYQLAFG